MATQGAIRIPKVPLEHSSDVYDFFVNQMTMIPQVEAVYAIIEEGLIDLWTIVEGDLYETEGLVIKAQIELLRRFPELSLDFFILSKDDQKLDEILPLNSVQIYSRDREVALSHAFHESTQKPVPT